MLIPMNQFAKMPGQNLEESFEVKNAIMHLKSRFDYI